MPGAAGQRDITTDQETALPIFGGARASIYKRDTIKTRRTMSAYRLTPLYPDTQNVRLDSLVRSMEGKALNIIRSFADLNRGRLRLMTVALALAAAGCASGGNETSELMPSGEQSGYRWVGQGNQGNFGSAYGMCRRTLQMQSFSSMNSSFDQRTADAVTYSAPNVSVTGAASQASFPNRRSFEGCMRTQGWALAGSEAQPMPASPPAPAALPGSTPGNSTPGNP